MIGRTKFQRQLPSTGFPGPFLTIVGTLSAFWALELLLICKWRQWCRHLSCGHQQVDWCPPARSTLGSKQFRTAPTICLFPYLSSPEQSSQWSVSQDAEWLFWASVEDPKELVFFRHWSGTSVVTCRELALGRIMQQNTRFSVFCPQRLVMPLLLVRGPLSGERPRHWPQAVVSCRHWYIWCIDTLHILVCWRLWYHTCCPS